MSEQFLPQMVISGAQTGADRGGLIGAGRLGYERGGWVPKGRLAEDGVVPREFPVTECSKPNYPARTRLNVQCSDATLIFSYNEVPSGGTRLTLEFAEKENKPSFYAVLGSDTDEELAEDIREWLQVVRPRVLNVAGSRESKARGIQDHVTRLILLILRRD